MCGKNVVGSSRKFCDINIQKYYHEFSAATERRFAFITWFETWAAIPERMMGTSLLQHLSKGATYKLSPPIICPYTIKF